jgi:hypothetical protein
MLLAARLRKNSCEPVRGSGKNRCNLNARSLAKSPSFQRAASQALPKRSAEQRATTQLN